jgi:hypothetical protein
MGEKKKGERVD